MTTGPDQPWSRRAIRDADHDRSSESGRVAAESSADQFDDDMARPSFAPRATPLSPRGTAEPLSYMTQERTGGGGFAPFRGRRPAGENEGEQPSIAAPDFRVRDYSPEGRLATPSWAPTYSRATDALSAGGTALDYQTQMRPDPPAASVERSQPEAPAPLQEGVPIRPERTMTRRELRALREAQEAEAAAAGLPAPAPLMVTAAIPTIDADADGTQPAETSQSAETPEFGDGRGASAQQADETDEPTIEPAPWRIAPVQVSAAHGPAADEPVALVEPPEPTRWSDSSPVAPPSLPADDPLAAVLGVPSAPAASERFDLPAPGAEVRFTEPAPEVVLEPEPEHAPVPGVDEPKPIVIDAVPLPAEPIATPAPAIVPETLAQSGVRVSDDAAHGGFVGSRDVVGGHGVVTTNALMLPEIPQSDFSKPLTTNSEIVITGSIDLPRSLSSTGAHPTQLDQPGLDHELDPGDHQVSSTGSQPVRAIKAVSTHTSTRGMITNTKPRGNRSLTILIVITGGMAVLVGALLVVGLATNAF